jgi:hypothetical protein
VKIILYKLKKSCKVVLGFHKNQATKRGKIMAKKKVEEVVEVELPSREELVSLAKEVNAVLNLEKPITFGKKVTDEELAEAIVKECKNNVYEIDFIEDADDATIPVYSEEAADLFELLGIAVLPGSPEAAEEKKEEVPEPKATGKKKDASAPVKEKAAAKEKTIPKVKVEKAPKEAKYTRITAFAEAVKNGKEISIDELDKKTDALYAKNGGEALLIQATKTNLRCIATLVALELMTKTKTGIQYIA